MNGRDFCARSLWNCLHGRSPYLTLVEDRRRDRHWSPWRILKFHDRRGRHYEAHYSVLESKDGEWRPFGKPLDRVSCMETT